MSTAERVVTTQKGTVEGSAVVAVADGRFVVNVSVYAEGPEEGGSTLGEGVCDLTEMIAGCLFDEDESEPIPALEHLIAWAREHLDTLRRTAA